MDERLRELRRIASDGAPDSAARLARQRARAGHLHRYRPDEVTIINERKTVTALRTGWVMVPRRLVPKNAKIQPRTRYEIVVEWRQFQRRWSPKTVRAVVPEAWWRAQVGRFGNDVINYWINISIERRQLDERQATLDDELHDQAWADVMRRLGNGPTAIPSREIPPPVRDRLHADARFTVEVVGSRWVVGCVGDVRFPDVLAAARRRSSAAKLAAAVRKNRATRETRPAQQPATRPRSKSKWSSITAAQDAAIGRLRAALDREPVVGGPTHEMAWLMGLDDHGATRLLRGLADQRVPGAKDLQVDRHDDEWVAVRH